VRELRHLELVVAADLSAPLARRLEAATNRRVRQLCGLFESTAPALLLVTTSACSPAECAGLTKLGRTVIILAPWSSAFQEQQYLEAGAAGYFVMSFDLTPLATLIRELK